MTPSVVSWVSSMSLGPIFRRLCACLPLLLALSAKPARAAEEPVVDPPGRVARLSLIEGQVSVSPSGNEEWAEAVLNRPLTSGDTVWVDKDGRAELQIGSASVHLDHDTSFGFIELDDDVMQMSLTGGKATIRVYRLGEHEQVSVETPNGAVLLNRVGEYNLEVDVETDRTIVKTRSGEAEMVADKASHLVKDGQVGVFTGLDHLVVSRETLGPRTEFEAWANDRDRREQTSRSARYVSRDVVGYEDLDDHGEWIHEPSYGYVWRPTYVAVDWAPYRYGRWAYIGPWGWTWIDDSYWGFAPFHYGRWVSVHHRWCWVPGPRHIRPVYAPALVGWVGRPSLTVSLTFGNVGWYPLGPREIYYPYYRHTPRYVRYVNVSNTTIINNTYITNVYGRGGHYDRGPDYRYRRDPNAITAVDRDHFTAGRSLGSTRLRMRGDDLHQWRDDTRPRGIEPVQGSLLVGQPRGRWASRDADRNREQIARFQANPKREGDYRPSRTRMDPDSSKRIDRPQLEDRRSLQPDQVAGSQPRALGNDRERIEVMRDESQRQTTRRGDHMIRPPVQSLTPDTRNDGRIRQVEPRSGDFNFDRSRERGGGRDYRDQGRSNRDVARPTPPPQTQTPRVDTPRVERSERGSSPAIRSDQGGSRQNNGHQGNSGGKSERARQFNNPKSHER
jgi:hypothetical protein